MYIKDIELKNFRNYKDLKLTFNPKVNLILGQNAQGKTNLLESIYMCSMGKSYRTSRDAELIRFEEEVSSIRVDVEKEYIDTQVHITINKKSKKSIKKDGIFIRKISDLLDNIYIVMFSPDDLDLVKDEPENRRKFIDREISQIRPSYYLSLSNYKKVLSERNTHLKGEKIDDMIIDVYDSQLAKYGAQIMKSRMKFIDKISELSNSIHSSITKSKESLNLIYEPNVDMNFVDRIVDEDVLENRIYELLKANINRDMRLRTTSVGPHKDDFSFMVNKINMRNFGSQGQQRTCALSVKLAELYIIKEETGEIPILLLDDVMSELDLERQEYLIKALKENQLFITTTHLDEKILNAFPDAKKFYVKSGSVYENQNAESFNLNL